MRAPFILYKRFEKGHSRKHPGPYAYSVQYWHADEERYLPGRSIDALAAELGLGVAEYSSTAKASARDVAYRYLERKGLPVRRNDPVFIDYLSTFWSMESDYVRGTLRRKKKKGRGISEHYVTMNHNRVERYARPFFGKLRLSQITPGHLERFLLSLPVKEDGSIERGGRRGSGEEATLGGLSTLTVNRIAQAVTIPLGEAYRLEMIRSNPAAKMQRMSEDGRRRGVLSSAEVRKLFTEGAWEDERARVVNLAAAATGLRLGEILPLRLEDITADGSLLIRRSYGYNQGMKASTKTERDRTIPAPEEVLAELRALAECNPHGDGFIFYGATPGKPFDPKTTEAGLYAALASIGIDEAERRRRFLGVHSWRHWVSTVLRGELAAEALKKLTGHSTDEMVEHYADHITDEDLLAVRRAQEARILPFITRKKTA